MTLAFSDDPPTRWMFPEPSQYLRHFPTFVRLYAGAGFDSGSVLAVEGNEGYAMWLPPGVHSDEEGIADLLRQSVAATRLTEILDLVAQMTSFQPAEPHWFLPLIGVDPMSRGRGRGSALLQHMLAQCDREQQLAYLDSTNARNIPCMSATVSRGSASSRQGHARQSFRCCASHGSCGGPVGTGDMARYGCALDEPLESAFLVKPWRLEVAGQSVRTGGR